MKKVTKIFALLVSLAIIAGTFSACGEKEVVSTGEKLTYWGVLDTNSAQTLTSYSELLMFQEMAKRTGIIPLPLHKSSTLSLFFIFANFESSTAFFGISIHYFVCR